jgi:ABC-type transporter Mla subunit MlaD
VTLVGFVMVITAVTLQQDTVTNRDSVPLVAVPAPAPVPAPPPPPPEPTIEQIRYMEGLKTATRGIAQIRDGLNRVVRTQAADSSTRTRAARRLGGLCGSGRSFISSGRPKMQAAAYADSLRILAKQLTTRLDSLSNALPTCEKTAGRDPGTVATTLTTRLKNYDDALLAFRNAQAAFYKPDSTKTVSQQ